MCEWSEQFGVDRRLIKKRIKLGWAADRAVATDPLAYRGKSLRGSQNKPVSYKGEFRLMTEWAEIVGLPKTAVQQRITKLGWSVERALETPVRIKGGKKN